MLPPYVVIDIETVANDRAADYYQHKKYEAPSNYKDPLKIEEYVTARKHEDQRKAGLSWWTGKVICICLKPVGGKVIVIQGEPELALLQRFYEQLDKLPQGSMLIGKNADSFDKPFLIGRAMANRLGVHRLIKGHRPLNDINDAFGFGSWASQRGPLGDYAFGLGLSKKLAHGSDVQAWYNQIQLGQADLWARVADYCATDTEIVEQFLQLYYAPVYAAATSVEASPVMDDIPFGSAPHPAQVNP